MRASRIDHSAMPPQESWRDVAAAYLVHTGLRLASRAARRTMALHLAAEMGVIEVGPRMAPRETFAVVDGEVRETG
jgi:hypothetical protein